MKLTNGRALTNAQFLHRDHLSSVRAITNSAGAVVERSVYKPFGEQTEWLSASQPAPETKGWIGERFDADAGLQYLNARYYDPVLGMFLQPDWWEVTKPGVGTNRFSYSFNDPVNGSDPSGHIIETGWDVVCVAYDIGEIGYGLYTGDDDMVASGMMNLAIDAGSALVPGLPAGAGRLGKAAVDAAPSVAGKGRKAADAKPPGLTVGQVGTYKDLKAQRKASGVKDGLDLEHVQSRASMIKEVEARTGRTLNKAERKAIADQGLVVAVPREMHRSVSPTFGGRNNSVRIAKDAANPQKAVRATIDAYRPGLGNKLMDRVQRDIGKRSGGRY